MDVQRVRAATRSFDPNRVNLVDEQDKIIASADKFDAHLGKGKLHQAVSLFLFRKNSAGKLELLLQKRAASKIVGAGEWANSLCGNVALGENHRQCVLRRLKEELGVVLAEHLSQKITELMVFNYQVPCNERYSENEIDHLFGLLLDGDESSAFQLSLNPDEVEDSAWVSWSDLVENRASDSRCFTPWFETFINNQKIISKIEQFLAKNI